MQIESPIKFCPPYKGLTYSSSSTHSYEEDYFEDDHGHNDQVNDDDPPHMGDQDGDALPE